MSCINSVVEVHLVGGRVGRGVLYSLDHRDYSLALRKYASENERVESKVLKMGEVEYFTVAAENHTQEDSK